MKVVPSQELGELGGREGSPTVFQWHWRYHLPSFLFWGLVLLPLVFVKENRRLQAWAILIPLAAVLIAFRMIANLFAFSPTNAEYLGAIVTSLASTWAIVWLLAHWLSPRRWLLAIVFALIVMLATGLLLCWCNYGLVADEVVLLLMFHSVASFSLVLSMALTGRFRRKTGLSTSFAVWLLPWTVFPLILGMFILLIGLHFFQGDSIMDGLLDFLSIGAIGGIVLYLLNLPFMLLAFRSPFYRRRFCAVFGLQCVEQRALNDIEIEPQE